MVDNSVYSITIDAKGNKWFGTKSGVSKFDGISWSSYTSSNGLANNIVSSIAIDAQGNKWFGTSGGVSFFNETEVKTPIEEINTSNLSLYPVPVTDNLTIKLNEGTIPTAIRIVNSLGQTVYSNQKPTEQTNTITMNDKPSGIYFVQILVEGKSFSKMVVKQ